MSRLDELYQKAIEQTKVKVYEDIDRFLETKTTPPSFEQYLVERFLYVSQIWLSIWLNITNNDVPRKEKKQYLTEKGYEVEGIDRKFINKLFRNEMKLCTPFDVNEWLNRQFFHDKEVWEARHPIARSNLLKRIEAEEIAEKKRKLYQEIEALSTQIIYENYDDFYLFVRYYVAQNGEKEIGEQSFNLEHKTNKKRDQLVIEEYLKDFVPNWIIKHISAELLAQFTAVTGTILTFQLLAEIIAHYINGLKHDYFSKIEAEYVEDLQQLAKQPFNIHKHREIYATELKERERKRQQQLQEIERKKAEESRMIEDIFGREYSPSSGRNIRYVLHIGETNTGKTYHALEKMKKAKTGLYLAPLRLLALEVYDKLNKEGVPCSLKTGEEEKEILGARHLSCTVEMFHEKSIFEIVVIDEAQMIADKDRGFSWYKAITKANAAEVHIIGSRNSKEMIVELLGDSQIEIHEYYRDIPLVVEKKEFQIKNAKKGDALVCFSRRRVLETASKLENDGYSVSIIYGSMPPETRKKQIERFIVGETKVIVATDAIGMGLNLPIHRIVFLENEKFDGTRRRRLTSQEVKQITGRAGRKGIYDVGKVAFTKEIRVMKKLLEKEDVLISTFAIAPTNAVFERFQKYYRDLSKFFDLWFKFESPKGTKKASLSEERELYATIRDTEVEARLSMMDLYGFLHLPFSKKDPELLKQWRETMFAIVKGKKIPEPVVTKGSLEELELSYKALGLHLLFLYRLDRGTEAVYWERLRQEISDDVHERLKTDVKELSKKCKRCAKSLPWDFPFQICNDCYTNY